MIKTAGKQFDPRSQQLYFVAVGPSDLGAAAHVNANILCAVNNMANEKDVETVRGFMSEGRNLLIDSGVFNLSIVHARKHGIHFYEALALAPEHIDGFNDLFDRYVQICRTIGAESWGYIEIDQGGRTNKTKIRTRLEKLGLRPIPVYHPLTDGWDYFDYLAARYDRICYGNVVDSEQDVRLRLVSTAYIRQRKYPHLWIHLLGLTPNELVHSIPVQSCDSSSWAAAVRWGSSDCFALGKQVGDGFDHRMTYKYRKWDGVGERPTGRNPSHLQAMKLSALDAEIICRNWAGFCGRYREALCENK